MDKIKKIKEICPANIPEWRSWLEKNHLKESKVIVISYNYYSSNVFPTSSQIKKPTFLFEWEIGSEQDLLNEFFEVLKSIYSKENQPKIVGFNHLAYDLNYLFCRMNYYEIAPQKVLFDYLFSFPRHVDLAQLGMAVSEKTKRDSDFRCISQKNINALFDIPIKEDDGKDLSKYYVKKNYAKIKQYCEEEFTFELLYSSVLEYFLHTQN